MNHLIYLETCNSSYFNGFDGEVVAVPVDATTTKKALRESIVNDMNATLTEDPFTDDADMQRAVDRAMLTFMTEHPFADIGDDLEMPDGYFTERNDDGSWSLYEGDEDDMENADLVEEGLPSRGSALVEAHNAEGTLEMDVYCYFGIMQD